MPGFEGREPLVSIGLPTYNRPEGLERSLQCLTSQTYSNIEIIISDNASPNPKVKEVAEKYVSTDSRVSYYRQQENLGFIRNFEFVYRKARGEYFMWASDDDEHDSEFIETCLPPLLDEKSNVVLSFCRVRKREPKAGRIIDSSYSDKVGGVIQNYYHRAFRYLYYSGGNHCFYGLYRRNVINSFFFEERFGIDHIAILSVIKNGSIKISDKVLFTSALGGGGFERENFHKYYNGLVMKIFVNLSSTVVWFFEFIRYVFLDARISLRSKIVLTAFVALRFMRFRYWRRFAGDMLALVAKPGIWNFKNL